MPTIETNAVATVTASTITAPEGLTYAEALEILATITLETPVHFANREHPQNIEVAAEDYPVSGLDLVDLTATYEPRALRATFDFAKSKPFQGSELERFRKMAALHLVLCDIYNVNAVLVRHPLQREGFSGSSFFNSARNVIGLVGKLSVLTYLHEFAHARGLGEQTGGKWAVNLFRRCFPQSFARLVPMGSALVMPTAPAALPPAPTFTRVTEGAPIAPRVGNGEPAAPARRTRTPRIAATRTTGEDL
jgi:hypothetical protein